MMICTAGDQHFAQVMVWWNPEKALAGDEASQGVVSAGGQAVGRGAKRSASLQLSSSLGPGTRREEVIQQGTHQQTHPRQPQNWTPSPGSRSPGVPSPGARLPAGDSEAQRQRPQSSSDEELVSAQEGTPSEEEPDEVDDEEGESLHTLSFCTVYYTKNSLMVKA